ncbi:hypothetical protein [Streptosporangium minutum]|uniref:Uncharacterized protein n=1 Tax=Streptosporangium minutum TaxID=569862 RepID=A0A243RRP6_9ACTN|nr:hypothetical protein [Streptosporangium minutum]OUC97724.1 hypothetical protein CA984_09925 [Streptosporangium minutum]
MSFPRSPAAGGHLEWDTDETVAQAAHRLSLDGAWTLRNRQSLLGVEEEVPAETMRLLGQHGEPRRYAANFLEHRSAILADLDNRGVVLGGPLFDTEEIAERAGIASRTLNSYLARDQRVPPEYGRNRPRDGRTAAQRWASAS